MKYERLMAASKWSWIVLVMVLGGCFLASRVVPTAVLSEWTEVVMAVVAVLIAGMTLPLGLVHAGLAAQWENTLERLDGIEKIVSGAKSGERKD